MNLENMSVFNDDGLALDLSFVSIFFGMPNFMVIFLTILNAYMIYLSKNRRRLREFLGELANFFAKGALDRIIKSLLQQFEMKKQQQQENEEINMSQRNSSTSGKTPYTVKNLSSPLPGFSYSKIYDANYLLLVPFQIDLLLTVSIYKILTRDVYTETCQSYLKTYHNRPNQVVCWLKHTNQNISNLSTNITLYQYCTNQTITYINYEHNDVICAHYAFRLINIIDTVTNIFAWHQAIVFFATKSITFCYWYQRKIRRTTFYISFPQYQHRVLISLLLGSILFIYVFVFLLFFPAHFLIFERIRIDLTRHLIYACSKFLVATIFHVNFYTLYQWHSLNSFNSLRKPLLDIPEIEEPVCDQRRVSFISAENSDYCSLYSTTMPDNSLGITPTLYSTPNLAV